MKKTIYIMIMLLTAFIISACVEVDVSEVTSVSLNFTPKDAYLVDEPVVLDDMELSVVFESGENQTLSLDDADIELTGAFLDSGTTLSLDTTTSGEKSLAVSYQGVAATVTFNVYDTIVTTAGYTSDYAIGFVENLINPLHSAYVATSAGGRVFVSTGTYAERTEHPEDSKYYVLKMFKNMTLIAGEDVVLDPSESVSRMIDIRETTDVTIDGFVISDNWSVVGVSSYGSNTKMTNNFINAPAVATSHGNSIQISGSDSKVIGNTVYGTVLESTTWSGSSILISPVAGDISDIEIRNNTVIREIAADKWNFGIAISIQNAHNVSDVVIDGNTIVGANNAIRLESAWADGEGSITSVDVTNNELIDVLNYAITIGQVRGGVGEFSDITLTGNSYDFSGEGWYSPLVLVGTTANLWDSFDWEAFKTNNGLEGTNIVIEEETFWNNWGYETYSWVDLS